MQISRNVQDRWRALHLNNNYRNRCWLTLERKHWYRLFLAAFVFTLKKHLLSGMKSQVILCKARGSFAFWRNDYWVPEKWSDFTLCCMHILQKYCKSGRGEWRVPVWNWVHLEALPARAVLSRGAGNNWLLLKCSVVLGEGAEHLASLQSTESTVSWSLEISIVAILKLMHK